MNRNVVLGIFAALVVAQLAIPAGMIAAREKVIREGQEYKFRVLPVDPYDAFRGRYVQLGFEPVTVPLPAGTQATAGQTVFVLLDKDGEGFVVVKQVSFTRPDTGEYLRARLAWPINPGSANVAWPFDRYYMEESIAPQAESLYRERARASAAYVTVRVLDGQGVITGLYLDGQPIETLIKE